MNTNTERLVVGGGALVLGLALGWMVRGVATYNTGAESSVPYGDWRVACPPATTKDASCEMVANLTDPKTKDVVARVSVSQDAEQGQVLALVLPLNTLLEQGVALKLGNTDPKIYKFRTCTQNGCISVTPADNKAIDAIAAADKVTLMSMSALPGATRTDTIVSMNGFSAARSAYNSGNRKRSSFFWETLLMRRAVLTLLALTAMSGAAVAQPAVGVPPKAAPKAAPAKAAAAPKAAAAAPAAANAPKRFGEFAVRCAQTKSVAPCDLYEERFDKNTGRRVIGFSIGYMPSTSRYIMQIAGPLGVAVDQGIIITDGKFSSPAMPYRRCDSTGCFVEVAIDKSLIDAFSKMGDAKIRIVAYGGKVYAFTFSFDGFAAAHEDMVAENKAKAVSPDTAGDAK